MYLNELKTVGTIINKRDRHDELSHRFEVFHLEHPELLGQLTDAVRKWWLETRIHIPLDELAEAIDRRVDAYVSIETLRIWAAYYAWLITWTEIEDLYYTLDLMGSLPQSNPDALEAIEDWIAQISTLPDLDQEDRVAAWLDSIAPKPHPDVKLRVSDMELEVPPCKRST